MNNAKFKDSKKASTYLYEKYELKSTVGSLKFDILIKIVEDLILNHTIRDLKVLKIGIVAQLERYKQANILISIVVFFMTTLFSLFSLYTTLVSKIMDKVIVNKDNTSQFVETFQSGAKEAVSLYIGYAVALTLLLVIIIFLYFRRYLRICILNNLITEALEGREKIEEEQRNIVQREAEKKQTKLLEGKKRENKRLRIY